MEGLPSDAWTHRDRPISIGRAKHGLGVDRGRHVEALGALILINVIAGRSWSNGNNEPGFSSHCGDAWSFMERRILIEWTTKRHQNDTEAWNRDCLTYLIKLDGWKREARTTIDTRLWPDFGAIVARSWGDRGSFESENLLILKIGYRFDYNFKLLDFDFIRFLFSSAFRG